MTEKREALRTVALVAGSLLVVFFGVLANVLAEKSKSGLFTSIAAAGAVVAITAIWTWKWGSRSSYTAAAEEAALKRIKLVLTATQDQLQHWWNVDIELPLSIARKREGQELSSVDLQNQTAFIASLAADPRCTIVTGAPGSGKSTLLRQLSLHMVTSREAGASPYTPLMLQWGGWRTGEPITTWVVNQTRFTYGIEQDITRHWLNRGSALLVVDGLDEMSVVVAKDFVLQFNSWLSSAVGGRAILSCRSDSYVRHFKNVLHEQVANLEPLPYDEISRAISRALDQGAADYSIRHDTQSLLAHVISRDTELSSVWSTPLLVRLLTEGVANKSLASPQGAADLNDPAAMAVELGDKLRQQGNERGAIESYLAAINAPASQWRSLAGVRASLLLARSGDYDRARQTLQSALATEIERSLHEPLASLDENLSYEERQILAVLSTEKTLDAFQVSSLASIPPGRSNSALRNLRDRGLVEVAESEREVPRFRRVSAELVEK